MVYGLQVEGSQWRPLRGVIGQVERSRSGNIVLRIGREVTADGGWEATEHIVLSPFEAATLIDDLRFALRPGGGASVHGGELVVDVVGGSGEPIDDRHAGDRGDHR